MGGRRRGTGGSLEQILHVESGRDQICKLQGESIARTHSQHQLHQPLFSGKPPVFGIARGRNGETPDFSVSRVHSSVCCLRGSMIVERDDGSHGIVG